MRGLFLALAVVCLSGVVFGSGEGEALCAGGACEARPVVRRGRPVRVVREEGVCDLPAEGRVCGIEREGRCPVLPENLRKHAEELEALAAAIERSGRQPGGRVEMLRRRARNLRLRADEIEADFGAGSDAGGGAA